MISQVQIEDSEQDNVRCIPHHRLWVIVKLARDSEQRKIVIPCICEEFDSVSINLQRNAFQKRNEGVNNFFIVEIVLE